MRLLLAIAVSQEDPHVGRAGDGGASFPSHSGTSSPQATLPSADGDDWADVIARHVSKQLLVRPPEGSSKRSYRTTVRGRWQGTPTSAHDGTANEHLDAPASLPARGTAPRTPDYARSPSKSSARR